ncbi:Rne/Rng family ribonuclease [Brevibacterium litoralis]|uniref:Rne/Rng family ribonuclease n=1 Tax=Brevibacterium litoralis TaxID=3138935 RepID=UPI0032EF435E
MTENTDNTRGTGDATDPTQGILADLENLRSTHPAESGATTGEDPRDPDVLLTLEEIARAAESRRTPEEAAAEARAAADEDTDDTEDATEAPADEDGSAEEDTWAGPASGGPSVANPFSFGGVFSAAPEPVDFRPAAPPAGGGLLFQAPEPELGRPVDPEWSEEDEDEEDTVEDRSTDGRDRDDRESSEGRGSGTSDQDDEQDSEDGQPRRRRRGGRGRRSKSRGGDQDSGSDQSAANADSSRKDSGSKDSGTKNDSPKNDSAKNDSAKSGGSADEASKDGGSRDSGSEGDSRGASAKDAGSSSSEEDSGEDRGSSRSRRRRRSRDRGNRGSSAGAETTSTDDVVGVKGSTRMEAKRQRRREGREAGRRRPVITEAEFLARRESVERKMVIREQSGRVQLVVMEDGIAVEHYLSERKAQASLIGNVYLGKVQNVLPSMEAAFIDIGKGRNAVLYAGEVNWDALGMAGKPRRIEQALKAGDSVLVQVTKDPIGHKGARLTSQISLPGRFLVYVPGNSMTGISRKLPENERQRLKKVLKELVGPQAGVIVRTAAEGVSETELGRDVELLTKRWAAIEKKSTSTKVLAPQLLYSEPDMTVRIVRDVFNEDFSELVIDGSAVWDTVHEYIEAVAPDLLERVHRYEGDEDVFEHHRIAEQIEKALDRKVNLPSGGSLVIDRTEAMTVVDVNTGKFTGSGGNLEETVTKNNLEAAEEVIRQLRLRDIGGIIVIDFIDMVLESNRDLVVRRLVECLGRDRTRHQVAEVTSLGLVQMTRKRIGTGLAESLVAAGEDLSGQGLLLPGSEGDVKEEAGSSATGGRGSSKRKSRQERDQERKDKRRGKKSGDEADGATTPQEDPEEAKRAEQARAAVAALATAAKKAHHDDEALSTAGTGASGAQEAAAAEGAGESAPEEAAPKKSRRSRKRSAKRAGGEKENTAQKSTAKQSTPKASEQAPQESAAAPAEPSGPQPLMIGLDAPTRVQEAPATPAPAATAPEPETAPDEKSAPKKAPAKKKAEKPALPVLMIGME